MSTITFVISSNGYGHCKRSLKLLGEINSQSDEVEFSIICKKERLGFIKELAAPLYDSITFHTEVMENEPTWLTPSSLDFKSYSNWVEKLKSHPALLASDLIISDNYVAPLLSGGNVLMMGSFLWADVIKDYHEDAKKIARFEKKTLSSKPVKMIVLESMYMPSLKEKVEVIEAGWFCTHHPSDRKKTTGNILITSGGTEQLDRVFINLIDGLVQRELSNKFYLDEKLYRKYTSITQSKVSNVEKFDFSIESFSGIDAIICRPGIGILTECIQYNIPPIVLYDKLNSEIVNNAKRVNVLKLGIDLFIEGNQLNDVQLNEIIEVLQTKERRKNFQENILKQKTKGHVKVAEEILKELTL